jgi:enamine deaminase RidA (YjgF/YER057c/UK114 family)
MKQARDPHDVHPPLAAYTHQIELSGAERLLVLSGQIGARPDGSVPGDALDQLEVAWDNIEHNLQAAGMQTSDLVKLTLYSSVRSTPPADARCSRAGSTGTSPA